MEQLVIPPNTTKPEGPTYGTEPVSWLFKNVFAITENIATTYFRSTQQTATVIHIMPRNTTAIATASRITITLRSVKTKIIF